MKQYLGDVLQDFGNGCRLDLRARIAKEFAQAAIQGVGTDYDPLSIMRGACTLADSLVKEFETRGWLVPLPVGTHITQEARDHIGRAVRSQASQAAQGPTIMREEEPKVATAVGSALHDPRNKR